MDRFRVLFGECGRPGAALHEGPALILGFHAVHQRRQIRWVSTWAPCQQDDDGSAVPDHAIEQARQECERDRRKARSG